MMSDYNPFICVFLGAWVPCDRIHVVGPGDIVAKSIPIRNFGIYTKRILILSIHYLILATLHRYLLMW